MLLANPAPTARFPSQEIAPSVKDAACSATSQVPLMHKKSAMPRSSTQNFARIEKKYLLTPDQLQLLMNRLSDHVTEAPFARGVISSLYYDTATFDVICASMGKPLYKEKLRVRAYNSPNAHEAVYVELKKKIQGASYKRRIPMSRSAAACFMAGESYLSSARKYPLIQTNPPTINDTFGQILTEIEAAKQRQGDLIPALMIIVDRTSYIAKDDPALRITFDHNARWRDWDLSFEHGTQGNALFETPHIIMEVKYTQAYPLWLSTLLSELKLRPQPCSKVCLALQLKHPQQPAHISAIQKNTQQVTSTHRRSWKDVYLHRKEHISTRKSPSLPALPH